MITYCCRNGCVRVPVVFIRPLLEQRRSYSSGTSTGVITVSTARVQQPQPFRQRSRRRRTTTTTPTPTALCQSTSYSYHELAYFTNGKPWSCLQHYDTDGNQNTNTTQVNRENIDTTTTTTTIRSTTTFSTISSGQEEDPTLQHLQSQLQQPQVWVQVELIAAPYNPADALSIQGVYPNPYRDDNNNNHDINDNPFEAIAQHSRRSRFLPNGTVPGSEGWGRIIDLQVQQQPPPPNVDWCSSISSSTNTEVSSNQDYLHFTEPSSTTTTSYNKKEGHNTPQPQQQQQPQQQPPQHSASTLQIGDYVIPGQPGLGTFRSTMWVPSTSLLRIDRGDELFDIYGPHVPAPLFQTGGTAYRMLYDAVPTLKSYGCTKNSTTYSSDSTTTTTIVQNAGNSAVGLMISQIAVNLLKWHCISIIRSKDRTDVQLQELQEYIQQYGNPTKIVTNASIDAIPSLSSSLLSPLNVSSSSSKIQLALNGVGGDSIQTLLKFLDTDATIVSYGNMSKQSTITIDPGQLIFRNLHMTGFWFSRWMVQEQSQYYRKSMGKRNNSNIDNNNNCTLQSETNVPTTNARAIMMNELVDAVLNGTIQCPPVQIYTLSDFQSAVEYHHHRTKDVSDHMKRKVVFDCREK
jgi:NADPH:quinone reductase-like Zn-dependent oxidoreductase